MSEPAEKVDIDEVAGDIQARIAELKTEAGGDPELTRQREAAAEEAARQESERSQALITKEQAIAEWRGLLSPLLRASFDGMAPAWEVPDSGVTMLAESYAAMLDDMFPGGAANMPAWAQAAVVTGMVIGPNIGKPRFYREQAGAAAADDATDTASPAPAPSGDGDPDVFGGLDDE